MTWTDDRIAALKALYKDGLSASQIANELGGCSRNAVIGKINRLGIRKRLDMRVKPKTPRPRSDGGRLRIKDQFSPSLPPFLPPDPEIPVAMRRCAILELTSKNCHWPIGDPRSPDFYFCGNEVAGEGCAYCAYHTMIAYRANIKPGETNDAPQS